MLWASLRLIARSVTITVVAVSGLTAQAVDKPQHWAFTAPKSGLVPPGNLPPGNLTSGNGPDIESAIDAFVVDRLEREGLKSSPQADRRTLIRRLTLDLTGLPPTLAEVNAFLADNRPDSYDRLVDD